MLWCRVHSSEKVGVVFEPENVGAFVGSLNTLRRLPDLYKECKNGLCQRCNMILR